MTKNDPDPLKGRIDAIRHLTSDRQGGEEFYEAATLAQTVLHDTVGASHPVMHTLKTALDHKDWAQARAAARAVVKLWAEGALTSPRLAIAHEIEGDLLEIAQSQVELAENAEPIEKKIHIAIAAFLAGAALEDALRRLCEAKGLSYDEQRSSISKLQSVLYQPSNQIELISSSDNKHLTAWGDTRNKTDHGKFSELTYAEVFSMVVGVQGFLDRHLP